MRSNQQNKNRSRGRNGGRKNVNPLSRNFESNGPDVKIRGNAAHIAERYVQLARDATATGDSVMAENYLQHAEHYFRILSAAQAQMQPRNEPNFDDDGDEDDASGANAIPGETDTTARPDTPARSEAPARTEAPANAAAPAEGETAQAEAAPQGEESKPRTRRPRRRRSTEDSDAKTDPAGSPQPEVPDLPAFLTGNANAAE